VVAALVMVKSAKTLLSMLWLWSEASTTGDSPTLRTTPLMDDTRMDRAVALTSLALHTNP